MNRRVIWILSLAIATTAAVVCIWRLYGKSAESSEKLLKPLAVGRRAGISEGRFSANPDRKPNEHMNNPNNDFGELSVSRRIVDVRELLDSRLEQVDPYQQLFIGEDGEIDFARSSSLLSREQWTFLCVSDLVGSVYSDHSFGYNGWKGYRLRNCLREIGAARWADLFERMYPLAYRIEELEGERQEGKITEDEYFKFVDPINEEMGAIEVAADVESYEEVELLLLKYAVKHGFAAPNAPAGSGDESGRGK